MRELTRGDGPPPAEVEVAEAELSVEEATWTVRVLGRSGAGPGGRVPLLLLGFWPAGSADDVHALEATVVARTLAELSTASLATALATAGPPPDRADVRSFFGETGQGRGR